MRRFHNRGLFALENEEVTPDVTPEDTTSELDALPDHGESAEGEVADLKEESGEIDQTNNAIDEAEDTVEALEAIRDALIEADKEGGLTRGGAAVLRVSLEHMYGRLGLPTDKVTPALESFGGAGTRQSATQVAIEDLKETAGNIWRKIVEWAKKVWDFVVKWYNKLFDTNTKVKARAEALLKAAEAIKGEPATKELDNAGLMKAVGYEGGADFKKAVDALAGYAGASSKAQGAYFDGITKMLADVEKGSVEQVPSQSFSMGLTKEAGKIEGVEAPEGADVYASKELPGRRRVISVWAPSDLKAARFEIITVGAAKEGSKLPVLGQPEVKEAATVAMKVCDIVSETKQYLGDADKAFKALIAVAEANVNMRQTAGEMGGQDSRQGEQHEAGKSKLEVARTAQKLLASATTKGNAYLLDAAKGMVSWGELSAKQYSASAEKKEAAPSTPAERVAGAKPAEAAPAA